MTSKKYDPDMSHLKSSDYKKVYEPSDDTWLFVDALLAERDNLADARISLEIGSGSCYVSTYLHNMINTDTHKCFFFAVDINEHAAIATRNTFLQNNAGIYFDVTLTPFGDALKRLQGNIDVLLFNPPYVPSEDDEVGSFLFTHITVTNNSWDSMTLSHLMQVGKEVEKSLTNSCLECKYVIKIRLYLLL